MSTTKSTLKLFLANITTAIFSFLGVVYFARELGPNAIGIFFLFEALLLMVSTIFDGGIRGAVEKRISEGNEPGSIYTTAFVLNSISIGGACVVLYSIRGNINLYMGENLTMVLIIGVLIYSASHLHLKLLLGELRAGETAILHAIQYGVWFIFGAYLVNKEWGLIALVYSFILGIVIKYIVALYKRVPPIGKPSIDHAQSLIHFGKYYIFSDLTRYFYNWLDIILIGYFLTATAVGQYEVSWRLAGVTILLSRAIGTAVFPQISSYDAQNEAEKVRTLTSNALTYTVLIIIPAFFATMLLSEQLLTVLFGSEYNVASSVLIVLIFGRIFQGGLIILERATQGINKPEISAKINSVSIMMNFILNIVLIYWFGIIGAAIATTFSYIISLSLHLYSFNTYYSITIMYRKVGWMIMSSIIMTSIIKIWINFVGADTLISLYFIITVSIVSYLALILLLPSFRREILHVAKKTVPF